LAPAADGPFRFSFVKQHYVPVCYLRAFVDPDHPSEYEPYIWIVDLESGSIRRRSPENSAALSDYAVGDGENRHDVEEYLSAVESQTAPVLARILGDYQALEPDDQSVLSYFAALQIVRVPQIRDRIEDFIARIAQTVNAMNFEARPRAEPLYLPGDTASRGRRQSRCGTKPVPAPEDPGREAPGRPELAVSRACYP
jgi:hypothetical protein